MNLFQLCEQMDLKPHKTSKRHAYALAKDIFNEIKKALVSGDEVRIKAFGTFETRDVAARVVNNFGTDGPELRPPHKRAAVKWSRYVKDAINHRV